MPGQDDFLEKEKQLLKPKEKAAVQEKPKVNKKDDAAKNNTDNLETALISIAKRKRHKDPKSRCRGLATSMMPRRVESDENEDKEHFDENTDYRAMQVNLDNEEEEGETQATSGKTTPRKKQPLVETESLTTVELMTRMVSVLMIPKTKSKKFILWGKVICSSNRYRLQHH